MRHQGKIFLLTLSVGLVVSAAVGIAAWRLDATPIALNTPTATHSSSYRPTSAGTATAPQRFIATKDLYQAPVPGLCEHPAGKLVDGSLPGIPTGQGFVDLGAKSDGGRNTLVFGDLTGVGEIDASAVFDCSQGGVNWPEQVVLYAPGIKILGTVDLGAVTPFEHADVEQMTIKSGDIFLKWRSYNGAAYCVKEWSAQLHWDGQKVAVLGLTQTAVPSDSPSAPATNC